MLKSDASDLKKLASRLRKAQPDLYRATQKSLKTQVGVAVALRAKKNASFSTRIPQTVKVSAAGVNTVIVKAGTVPDRNDPKAGAPHAKALEHAGDPGFFRHPLNYPNQGYRLHWVDQKARPFLHPAALDRLAEDAETVAAALTVQVEKTIHGQDLFV